MNLLAFRYFLEVAKTLNFSKTSETLNISQPGLSQQMMSLENELGIKLLNRSTRKVMLTEEGEYLVKSLQPSFEHIENVIRELKENQQLPSASLRIATVPSAASNLIPIALKQLRSEMLDFEFNLQEVTSLKAVELVESQRCHLAFIRTPIDAKRLDDLGLHMLEFERHPLQVIVSAEHPIAGKSSVDLYDLRNEPFIHYDEKEAPSLFYLLERACLSAGFIPNTIGGGPEILTISTLVSNGLGITLMPRDMYHLIQSHRIKAIDIDGDQSYSSISAIWKKASYVPLVTKRFLDILQGFEITSST
ncbi:LysR family transcriptional regulator [Pseudalkalibacillus sp. A8]|uniref:LysR family transcriptional regulator n=1 Tax=Pseudalkalibacillus sp. A8 TaxID=3382641 RepID=UPI0038B4A02C